MKKRLPKAEYERKRAIKIAIKAQPELKYQGGPLVIENSFRDESGLGMYADPLMAAMMIRCAISARRYNKMWGPVKRK